MSVLATSGGVESVLPLLGTVLVATAFYAATMHITARWVIGETPISTAIGVGVGPAIVTVALDPLGPAVVAPLTIIVDGIAIHGLYDRSSRETAGLVLAHVVVSVMLGIALFNLILLVG